MRVIVCGTRGTDAKYKEDLHIELDNLEDLAREMRHDPVTVVHGDCPDSPDKWAEEWKWLNPRCRHAEPHSADWKRHGKNAGPHRNREMALTGAEYCVAVWDSHSSGTLNMIQNAVRLGIPVRIVPCGG